MNLAYSNYYKTKDNEQIYYSCNFKKDEIKNEVPLIFNYGLVCSFQHFENQINYLNNLHYPIIIYDYRGHFNSSGKDNINSLTFDQMTDDLKGILDSLNITRVDLVGHSMGVNVSLEMAKKYPNLVRKMILISGTPFPVQNVMFDSNITDYLIPKIKDEFIKNYKLSSTIWKFLGFNPIVRKLLHQGGFNMKKVPNQFVEIYLNKISKLGPDVFFKLMDEMRRHDILAFIKNLEQETLIIGGDKDKVIPNWIQRTLHENLKNSSLYIVKNGSHVPQVDFPDYINERLHLFLTN